MKRINTYEDIIDAVKARITLEALIVHNLHVDHVVLADAYKAAQRLLKARFDSKDFNG
jgi:hypothetical protein